MLHAPVDKFLKGGSEIELLQDKGLHFRILAYNYMYASFNKYLALSEELGDNRWAKESNFKLIAAHLSEC